MTSKPDEVRRKRNSHFGPGTITTILFFIGNSLFWGLRPNFDDWFSYIYTYLKHGNFASAVLIIFFVTSLLALWIAPYIYGSNRMSILQTKRDAEAVVNTENALFLRPFYWDKIPLFKNPFKYYAVPGFDEPETFGPEEFVGRVLEPFINVVEVGGGTDTVGNGRLQVMGEDWQDSVVKAIEAASVIVILPVTGHDETSGQILGEGTIWELKYLVQSGRISRTIAIMPQAEGTGWEQTRSLAAEFGLTLPAHDIEGGIITFEYSSGGWRHAKIFREGPAKGLVEAFKWLTDRESIKPPHTRWPFGLERLINSSKQTPYNPKDYSDYILLAWFCFAAFIFLYFGWHWITSESDHTYIQKELSSERYRGKNIPYSFKLNPALTSIDVPNGLKTNDDFQPDFIFEIDGGAARIQIFSRKSVSNLSKFSEAQGWGFLDYLMVEHTKEYSDAQIQHTKFSSMIITGREWQASKLENETPRSKLRGIRRVQTA